VARLKPLQHVSLVLGAVQEPGGMGERLLKGLTPHDDGERLALEHALSVLDDVRRLDPSRQFLALGLLKYLQNQPVQAAKQSKKLRPPEAHSLPITADSGLSDYFFS
ncbi:MAG: hypothetical protein WCG26_15470, partial [Chloroflexales bacterium]